MELSLVDNTGVVQLIFVEFLKESVPGDNIRICDRRDQFGEILLWFFHFFFLAFDWLLE